MVIKVKTKDGGYDIVIERGVLSKRKELLNLKRKVLVVTDDNVPQEYSQKILNASEKGILVTIPHGEKSKSLEMLTKILDTMIEEDLSRTDCVVAAGGGVIGDLAGFAASIYMRGIDFYNIPTTVLSQVDSSVGGKTAIDYKGYKNLVGAFWQPKKVIIDPDVLKTLPKRQISNGLAEALKMSMTSDEDLFRLFEEKDPFESLDEIITRAVLIKRDVVEKDERERGLRKILNFGHTLAHAIESADGMNNFLHGESVAIGMIPMCSEKVRQRLLPVLKKLSLPTEYNLDKEKLKKAIYHDKKIRGDEITAIYCETIGTCEMKKMKAASIVKMLTE